MDRDATSSFCATLPGANLSAPFGPGHDIWKIGGKIFAAIGAQGRGVSVKCADIDTAEMLRETGAFEKAPYFHRSWVLLPFETTEEDEAEHRITMSYDLVRASLTKKLQASFPPRR
ncbi:MmcQ/YjbR family DNA-binding protein [Tropicimonas sp. TH_r6]|uniref:MmcQ/YjbR family DNA-binding protein n=1 Tax=Tropicimonas sp. TH_r6 TaxID=3082085 RepID=UPI0029532F4F|nr:MmcQ/YjbR family DNA-binding protein [Tropicimonas sp. TH_r6]MDV7142851.1 MmcQ/YjbR family DNA-binding protein [Tropicimonas sp. TH_r6]